MSIQKYAQVIVDVPTLQTNIPYTYHIPEELEGTIQKGIRVAVPFGQGNRLVQGFVIGLTSQNDFAGEVKSVQSVFDFKPVLTDELLTCGQWLAETTFSFMITCLQAMLPSALRATYDKAIILQKAGEQELNSELISKYFTPDNQWLWSAAEKEGMLAEVKYWLESGWVTTEYLIDDKQTKKTKRILIPLLSSDEYKKIAEKTPSNAIRQRQLLDLLNLTDEPLLVTDLVNKQNIPRSTIDHAQKSQWCEIEEIDVYRDPYADREIKPTKPLKLNNEQQSAYDMISHSVQESQHDVFLLQGVTGSGKTEVYMQVIAKALAKDQGAIVLVPEISLTPQMVHRFKSRFGDQVAVMHSGLSEGERLDEWRRVKRQEASIVVGARSSIFAPIENIGVIIVDEEHESSYKQEDMPRYHARDVAIWRAQWHQCPVILGSATPSLESRARAEKGVYRLIKLNHRATAHSLAPVYIEDMRVDIAKGNRSPVSLQLKGAIDKRLAAGEQIVLLLNRRGFSSFVLCRDCGYVHQCPNCDISLTLHMDNKTMRCHYCGHEEAILNRCPECQSHAIRYYGTGTQKVEKQLHEIFPEAQILRMDNDTTRRKGAHARILNQFKNKEADILLGTQMIAKGLDFPNVTLVGVLNADTALGLPDFRSAEKTFQLLTQVSGRAGRGEQPGEVYIQTFNPDHYAIQLASQQDYDQFFYTEMKKRHQNNYSPYYYLIKIQVSHQQEQIAAKEIQSIYRELLPTLSSEAIVLGPSANSIARTHNQYHYQLIIKYKSEPNLFDHLHHLAHKAQSKTKNQLFIQIDPQPTYFL